MVFLFLFFFFWGGGGLVILSNCPRKSQNAPCMGNKVTGYFILFYPEYPVLPNHEAPVTYCLKRNRRECDGEISRTTEFAFFCEV